MKPVELPAAEPGGELAALVAERNELVRLRARNKIGIVVQTAMMAAFISLLSWSFVAGSIGLWPFVLLTAVVCGACLVYVQGLRLYGLSTRGNRRGEFGWRHHPHEGGTSYDTTPARLKQRLAACEARIEQLSRKGNKVTRSPGTQ